jgi:DNA-binding NarL/FixJ family response regulator
MNATESPLNYADPVCSLGLFTGRVSGAVVGRPAELAAIEQALTSARQRMFCLALEGEPGIGKTRLLLAIDELARGQGYGTIAVTADEEIQGPFLIARSIFTSCSTLEAAEHSGAEQIVQRVTDVLLNKDDPGLDALSPDQKLLRVFDLAAVALQTLASQRPLALLIDDVQWADEDSLRLLRYVFRVAAGSPILLVLAMRAGETAFVNEAVTLLADMDRMGILRRLRLGRFSQQESTEFLKQVLGGPVNLSSSVVMHAQAEGVPFVLAEQAHAYREAGLIQQIDGVWTLARNAERLVPSAVQTLIRRRGAHLSDATKASLSEAAILGRSFSLRDLHELRLQLGEESEDVASLAESLAPAVDAALLVQLPDASPADYSFSHDQIRQFAIEALPASRRRAIHAAIVEMFLGAGEPTEGCLSALAQHAMAAGLTELAVQYSVRSATTAVEAHAPEEVLRLVDMAHPIASSPQDRVSLLRLRDDALEMLRRPAQRLEGLTELFALADAMGDFDLEMDVMLRRAAALRLSDEHEQAAEIARRVRQRGLDENNPRTELAACIELGQDLLRVEIGEAYAQTPSEGDIDGAEEAYKRAAELAAQLGDDSALAAAYRELGIIGTSRVRMWFISVIEAGEHLEVIRYLTTGGRMEDILPTTPIYPVALEAGQRLQQALEIFERIGDRRGAMATLFGMAFLSWGPEIHLTGSVKRIEELHRLMMRLKSLTKESERALADAQMLFGAHVYSRAKVFPDMAISKGKEAYDAARTLGDRSLEFALAGGVALAFADIADSKEAERWLERAAKIAAEEPTPLRARQLESWRGLVGSSASEAQAVQTHLTRAAQLATEQGKPAAQCEAQVQLALEAARLGAERNDSDLLEIAETAAKEALTLTPLLTGHAPWAAQAHAALARVLLARGQPEEAARAGKEALSALDSTLREDLNLRIVLPAADAILAGGNEEDSAAVRERLQLLLPLVAQRITDEDIRVRWFRAPVGRELARLAGPPADAGQASSEPRASFSEEEAGLLRLLTQGRTNREIAEETGEPEESIARRLAELYVKIGVSSRAAATATAVMGKLV